MKKLCLFLLLLLCCGAISGVYAVEIQQDLSDNLVRMHIVANSDSENDQKIKLAVRDDILKSITEKTSVQDITDAANQSLKRLGTDYIAAAKPERCFVPEKEYKNLRLPEGMYNCVKVVLGEGAGENWWCVAYPPLCFTEDVFGDLSADGEELLKNQLSEEALKTIIKNGDINFRFKIVEDIQKLRCRLENLTA
ncbi:MAG: stage II sporulation protein R [Clostridia bacterium]|nr:stage II sporulation protein R [Clostridia bacterium]